MDHLKGDSDEAQTHAPGDLTDLERQVLEFAALRWKYSGAMESRVRETFGWSLNRYFQVLNALLDRPEAPPMR